MIKKVISLLLVLALSLGIGSAFATEAPSNEAEAISDGMRLSEDGIQYLKKTEGYRDHPYWDYSQWTIGYGTRCPDEKLEEYKTNGISLEAAEELFKKELATYEKAVNNLMKRNSLTFSQNQFDALVSFSYNVGTAWTLQTSSKMRQAVLNGATGSEFVNTMIQWCNAGGEILPILVTRRIQEANMYLNGDYTTWKPANFCYVYYSANGGYTSQKIQGFIVDDEDDVTLPYATCDGREFLGWYTDPTNGTKVSFLTKAVSGATLYARWDSSNDTNTGLENPVKIKVTGTVVNLREGHGTNFKSIGTAIMGDELTITEVREGTGYTWGKSEKGWICLRYTNYDNVINGIVEPEPSTESSPETTPEIPEIESSDAQNKTEGTPEEENTTPAPTTPPVTPDEEQEEESENITESKPEDNQETNSQPEAEPEKPEAEEVPTVQKGVVKVNDALRIRKGPSISYDTIGYLYGEDKVEIFETKEADNMTWGRIGDGKWASLSYIQIIKEDESSTTEDDKNNEAEDSNMNDNEILVEGIIVVNGYLRVREEPSINGKVLKHYQDDVKVSITELKNADSMTWGKTAEGWVCMDYVEVDISGNVTADCLRVRRDAGTNNGITGFLLNDAKVSISRIKLSEDNVLWGKISRGWISMDYVK